jgi:predicted TIM-barrel fold metal-dependent hydrolase
MPAGPSADLIAGLRLVDGHCHSILAAPLDANGFEMHATEATVPAPPGVSYLDGAAGLAIRRWCAPVLEVPPGRPIAEYLSRRQELGVEEVNRRLLQAAGLSHLLVDTGLAGPHLLPPAQLGALAGAEVGEVVRLEAVAEKLAAEDVSAAGFASAYRDSVARAAEGAMAVKSILAYRGGFDFELGPPDLAEVRTAAGHWLAIDRPVRMDDPVLLRFLLWCGVEQGLPIQIHTGLGDRELMLCRADPSLLQPFLAATEPVGVPVVLLHCYPYHRQAGWLAQVYSHVHVDFGLTVTQVGARADAVLEEFFELAPFGKLMFSTDGYALPELYLAGAAQFRHSLAALLDGWVADGVVAADEARRLALAVGSENARRVYRL